MHIPGQAGSEPLGVRGVNRKNDVVFVYPRDRWSAGAKRIGRSPKLSQQNYVEEVREQHHHQQR